MDTGLTEDWLADALEKITCPDMKENAEKISKSIREEDGVQKAVDFFNSRLPFTPDPEITVYILEVSRVVMIGSDNLSLVACR